MRFLLPRARRANLRNRVSSRRRFLHAECLEQRRVLTSYIVDTLGDTIASDGEISLREAVEAANSNSAVGDAPAGQAGPGVSDSISFAPSLNGQVLTLSGGTLSISDALRIYDTNVSPIIIDGDASQQIFTIENSAAVSISDVTLRDGAAALGGAILVNAGSQLSLANTVLQNNLADQGGAIYNDGGSVTILGSTLTSNQANAANGSGGAIFSAAGSVTLVNSSVTFNSANRAGGGIEVVDGSLSLLRTSLIRNDVNGNAGTPSPGNGGGIHVTGNATTTVAYSVVFGNLAASEGGGLWNQAGSTMTIRDSIISSNEAFGATATEGGGGVFNNGGIVDISGIDTIISDNFASGASGSGGGIFNDGGQVTITEATIQANVANRAGGGIEATAGSTTDLINVLLVENNAGVGPDAVAAPGNGGGFHITGAGDASIIGGEVSDNVAAREGGGLWNGSGLMTIDGTEIIGNVASGPSADDGGGGIFNNGGPMIITGAIITDNIADGESGSGGGLLSLSGAIEVTATTFSFNSANRAGGGIEVVDGSLALLDSNLISNDVDGGAGTANPGNGGGLHITGITTTTIEGGSVFGNLAASEGGGLWNQAGSTMTIRDSIISSNEAFGDSATEGGGGVFNNGGIVDISGLDTIISDNFASGSSGSGGGIFNDGGQVTITDATIQANVANRAGGGIEATAGSTTDLINVLLIENNAGVGPDAVAAPGNGGGFHITGAGDATIIGGEVSDNVA
ncbi:MAG: beta strand repeat-containing protein, partial [Pirellulaceae bacterium]